MKTKMKIDMGLKTKKKLMKKWISVAKRDGILPILSLLRVFGSLAQQELYRKSYKW